MSFMRFASRNISPDGGPSRQRLAVAGPERKVTSGEWQVTSDEKPEVRKQKSEKKVESKDCCGGMKKSDE
jgi:hypothetical protein